MGASSGAGAAPPRTSVVSLTNGPSIMIQGRLGVLSTPVRLSQPGPFACEALTGHDSARNYARHLRRYVAFVRFYGYPGPPAGRCATGWRSGEPAALLG